MYLHVYLNSHHLGMVITLPDRSVGVTDDRSAKVGHYVATLAVVLYLGSFKLSFAEFCCGL